MDNNQPIRVLQAVVANDYGGLTSYVCQNYRHINKNNVQFDFITYDETLNFEKEFIEMGARFYRLPKPTEFFKYLKLLSDIQKKENYKVIHLNTSYANILPIIAGNYLACSKAAAMWMFPTSILKSDRCTIVNNAIETEKFKFDVKIRNKKREELSIEKDEFCIGHVGRFTYSKNHEFLFRVFNKILDVESKAKLVLVGDGIEIMKLQDYVVKTDIEDRVLFLGDREDVNEIMQAMDCFVLPSRFEGLPIVGIEAQAAGLPCYFSDNITREIGITDAVKFLPIDDNSIMDWANCIIGGKSQTRVDLTNEISRAGYNIHEQAKKLENYYRELLSND